MELKDLHNNWRGMPETSCMIVNVRTKLASIIDLLLTESTLNNKTDSQLRTLAAEAKGIRDILNYVTQDPKSITRASQ